MHRNAMRMPTGESSTRIKRERMKNCIFFTTALSIGCPKLTEDSTVEMFSFVACAAKVQQVRTDIIPTKFGHKIHHRSKQTLTPEAVVSFMTIAIRLMKLNS